MLDEGTLRLYEQFLLSEHQDNIEENSSRTYTSLVLHRKLRSAVPWIIYRERGGVYHPIDTCYKTE